MTGQKYNPIYSQPTPQEIAARNRREAERRERQQRQAAESRAQLRRFANTVSSTFSAKGETDAQAKERRAKEKKEREAETAAAVARNQAAAKQRAVANTPTAEERAFREARNTRVDRLTDEQRRLLRQGRPDTPKEAAARRAAPQSTAAEADKKTGGGGNSGGSTAAAGGSSAGSSQPTVLDLSNAPSPSEESQPKLVNDVRQGSRFARDGVGRSQVFDINSFRSEILENDVLPSHSYLVTFAPFRAGFEENAPLTRFVTNKRNTLVMRCENIVLPTSSLLEEEVIRRYGYGPVEKVPYGIQFSDVTMTWLVDKKSEIIDFFHQWMNTIVMHDSQNTLMQGGQKRSGLRGYDAFEVGYKDAYSNPIVRIYVYNRQNQTVTTYEMYDVFPMNIQAMNLSWADENELQKLTVTFAYTNMRVNAPLAVDEAQSNFLESGRLPPLMERLERLDDAGGSTADSVPAPTNETLTTTANASQPDATESPPPASTQPLPQFQPTVRNIA